MPTNPEHNSQWESFANDGEGGKPKNKIIIIPVAVAVLLLASVGACILIINKGYFSESSEDFAIPEVPTSGERTSTSRKKTGSNGPESSSTSENKNSTIEKSEADKEKKEQQNH